MDRLIISLCCYSTLVALACKIVAEVASRG